MRNLLERLLRRTRYPRKLSTLCVQGTFLRLEKQPERDSLPKGKWPSSLGDTEVSDFASSLVCLRGYLAADQEFLTTEEGEWRQSWWPNSPVLRANPWVRSFIRYFFQVRKNALHHLFLCSCFPLPCTAMC